MLFDMSHIHSFFRQSAYASLLIFVSLCFYACGQTPATTPTADSTLTAKVDEPDAQLRQDIGEMLLVGFRGTTINNNSHIVRDIQQYHVGSVILFEYDAPTGTRHRNIKSPQQIKQLCDNLQEYGNHQLLIGIDQEGGNVARLRVKDGFPATATAEASAQAGDQRVRENALVVAQELYDAGINLNFAPCVDVNVNPNCPVIGKMGRSFSNDADKVAHFASIWLEVQHSKGVVSCLKHFPGHGSASGDTHAGLVDVSKTWTETELTPYRKLIKDGNVEMIMVAHVINRQWGDNLPASLSPMVVKERLRNEMGFQGVIVTDDLAMGAITKQYGFEEALRLAIAAGCDLLCLSNNGNAYDPDLVPRAVEAIIQYVHNGELSAEDIHASAERIRNLKKSLKDE